MGIAVAESFHAWHLGAIALGACCQSTIPPLVGESIPRLSPDTLQVIVRKACGLTSTGRKNAKSAGEIRKETEQTLRRIVCTQSSLQGDAITRIALTLFLMEIADPSGTASSDSKSADSLFLAKFGCTCREYASLMFAMWNCSFTSDVLNLDTLLARSSLRPELRQSFRQILHELSCPIQSVSERIATRYSQYEAEGLIQAFYSDTPLLRVREELYLYPPHPFLLLHVGNGSFFRALVLAREDAAKSGSSRPETNTFNERMGIRFEEFLNELLSKLRSASVFREYEYARGHNMRSPDLLIFDSAKGDKLCLVQAKLKRLRPGSFFGFSRCDFEHDSQNALAELVSRSITFLHGLEAAQSNGRLAPAYQELSERVRNATQVFLLGIVPMMPALFRVRQYRELLFTGVLAKLNQQERAWFETNKSRIAGWHIVDAEEVSAFVSCHLDGSLFDAMTQYLRLPEFGSFLTEEGLLPSFRDAILQGAFPTQPSPLPQQQQIFDSFVESVSTTFFGTKDAGPSGAA